MPEPRRRPLWAGRTLALAAILLLALNLRSAVAALSPIAAFIAEDVPLDALALGVLGMLAPVAFASCGLFAPALTRRFGLEATLVGACVVMLAGPLLRASAGSSAVLFAGTALTFLGMGVGNVLLPPAVKRYFPDRIGALTAAYATLLAVSTTIPPAIAVPLAEATSWRVSLAVWGVFALCALVPWAVLWARGRRSARAEAAAGGPGVPAPQRLPARRLRSSLVAWAMVLTFGVSSLNAYTMFAWLPQLLIEHAGVTAATAGALLAVYSFTGFPMSLAVPVLAARMRSVAPLIYVGSLCFVSGYLGLLLAPETATLLWVVLAGAGPLIFPVVLVLINTRTRTPAGSVALSGFTQGLGYTAGALGPLVVSLLHEGTGDWSAPLIFLLITGCLPVIAGFVLRKPGYVDEPSG
ncbi:MFS transporter [Lysobacter korlensis]|uniref:MFS transporter n=1 Tax=Lysobacter korlensis TaxID=553636 RepID=A0ABV6RY46_9GAMM